MSSYVSKSAGFSSKEDIAFNADEESSDSKQALPPTPPFSKIRFVKNQQRTATDRASSSLANINQSPERPQGRRDSNDSGLVSGGGSKLRSAESGESSPGSIAGNSGNISIDPVFSSNTSRDNNMEARLSHNEVTFHGKGAASEKYLSTASDRAADHEVSSILTLPSEPVTIWQDPEPEEDCDVNVENDHLEGGNLTSLTPGNKCASIEQSPRFHRRRDVASLLRDKKNRDKRSHTRKQSSSEDKSSRNSELESLPSREISPSEELTHIYKHQPPPRRDYPSQIVPKPSPRTIRSMPVSNVKTVTVPNVGVSSTDTHNSSVRYEPVMADHSFMPASPDHHSNRQKLLGNRPASSHSHADSDSDVDDIDSYHRNVKVDHRREEERPLNSKRRRSPVDHLRQISQYGDGQSSAYMTTTNTGNVYVPKAVTHSSLNDQRHHTGHPRMGTGIVPTQANIQTSSHLPSSTSMYHQQSPSIVTSRASSSNLQDTEHYLPVVSSKSVKPAYEIDETDLWSYSRGSEAERTTFGGYPASVPPSSHVPHNPSVSCVGNNTAARFMNERSAFPGRHSNVNRNRRDDGAFKRFRSRCGSKCSWKCIAFVFITLSIILLALVAFFTVQLLRGRNASVMEVPASECITGDSASVTSVVKSEEATVELQLKRRSRLSIAPRSFNWIQVYVEESSHLKFNCSISSNAQLVVYGRKGLRPSHAKFDFFEKIDGSLLPSALGLTSRDSFLSLSKQGSSRRRRSTASFDQRVIVGFLEYLDAGTWHFGVYNDGENEENMEIVASTSEGLIDCPHSCNNNGDCTGGVCKCFPGFQGKDCSQVSCMVTCRGNGVYSHGKCICFSGWKGVECSTPSDKCIVPDCGGHGQCGMNGECVCEDGYKGESCQELDCIDPSCSGHGVCFKGQCRCDRGWRGTVCGEEDLDCMANCAGHGTFDDVNKQCSCEPGWGGTDCSTAICRPACHAMHGVCVDGACRCEDGWTGDACDLRQCHARCEEHGSCVRGECVCDLGWNGDLCTLAGCPNDCSNNGNCIHNADAEWFCACKIGWKGESCSISIETQCTDARDNDMDTLVDCQDPDCCSHRSCIHSTQCRGGLDPSHEMTRARSLNPLPHTASFFNRTKFLISRRGVQIGANISKIQPRRASVIRGRVITHDGSPLVGVQVQVAGQLKYGTTKTRVDGWFDMLVNGGGTLTLNFQRSSFVVNSMTVFIPWNDYIVVPIVRMRTLRQPMDMSRKDGEHCEVSRLPPPRGAVLVSSVRAYTAAECFEKGSVIPEIQAIREAVSLPSTQTSLVYVSSRAEGYLSTLTLSLIEGEKPVNLNLVHVRISVQGGLFEKKFEPVSELRYTYEWPRVDAYGQRVYGSVNARVMIGYEYESCSEVIWQTIGTKLTGYDVSQSNSIGLWSLDIHHTYHPEKGVVYMGNGGEMRLLEQPPMMTTAMGNGMSRHDTCDRCNGPASKSRLMSPVALASDANGNVYVGDHNFIRKLDTAGNVSSLFSTRSAPAKYYLAVSPIGGETLYFSNPNERRIYKLRQMSFADNRRSRSVATNFDIVAGNGEACHPLQRDDCGDGGPATSARLSAPKGLDFDKEGRLYFVDGTRIRTIEPDTQLIKSIAGTQLVTGTRPLLCEGSMSLDQLELNFPTDLAINRLDDTLYVLDGEVVIRIDIAIRQASLIAGVPLHCARSVAKNPDERDARKVPLVTPTSITISSRDGALYISESDQKFVHRVRRVDPYSGRITTVAGIDSDCDCAVQECQCFGGDGDFARSGSLQNPTAITAVPDGSVFIADQLNLRIRKILHSLPLISKDSKYSVSNPDTNQLYSFDRSGRHLATSNIITGTLLYTFSYAGSGQLSAVTDVNRNMLQIEYTEKKPTRFILPDQSTLQIGINRNGYLAEISRESSGPIASFTYEGKSGLVRSKVEGRHASSFYVYDVHGRLLSAVSSTGSLTSLHVQVNQTKHTVTMETAAMSKGDDSAQVGVGRRDVMITTEPGYLCDIITTIEGAMRTKYKRWTDNSISVHYLDDSELRLETKPHPVLGLTAPFLAKRTIQLPSDPLENKIEWRTRKEKEHGYPTQQFLLGRRMRVNDRNILSLDFSQGMMMEKIYDDHAKFMLRVLYNDRGLPNLWMPKQGSTPVNVTYDRMGHAATWQRGRYSEEVRFDVGGNPLSKRTPDGSTWRYTNGDKIVHLNIPGLSSSYTFTYDTDDNLQRVAMPSGRSYTIDRKIGIGFIRTTISGPDNALTLIQDHDDRGNALSTFHLGEKRKVIYRYDTHGHVTEILHDSTRSTMLRDPHSGELITVSTKDCIMRFHRNGPLVQRHSVTSSINGGLLATFDYTHDTNLRLSSLEVKVNGTRLPFESRTYNDVSGKLTAFGSYRIINLDVNLYAVGSQASTLTKQLDNNGWIVQAEVEIYSTVVFNMLVEYDDGGRVSSLNKKIGMYANNSRVEYTYTESGALRSASIDGAIKWTYSYDMDGRLSVIESRGPRKTLRYDGQGRLTSLSDLQYEFDQDGFLRQRGNEVFEYDSMGHLIKAYRLDKLYEINYGYDGFGRLATRVDIRRNQVLRYLYADLAKPTQLTHVYNASSGHLVALRYDVEGHLFSLERSDGITWSVVCDHVGTPLAVMDIAGYIAKRVEYSPFGEVLYDSAPEIHMFIGFRSGIYDVSTGLVHFSDRALLSPINEPEILSPKPLASRPSTEESSGKIYQGVEYDALIGQFTSSDIASLAFIHTTAVPLNLYQICDPVNLIPKYNHMTDTQSWLDALGFKLQNVAPDPRIASRQKDKSSAECQLSHHLSSYMNLQTATASALVPGKLHTLKQVPVPGGSLFAQGLVIAIDGGTASTQVLDLATNDVKRLSGVINGADVIVGTSTDSSSAAMSLTLEAKPTLYLAKPASSFDKDVRTLRLIPGQEELLDGGFGAFEVSASIAVSLKENEIQAESGYAIVDILYVSDSLPLYQSTFSTSADVRERILREAQERAEKEAWLREQRKIQRGLRTRWSGKEQQELLSRGFLTSYNLQLFWDPKVYPELADSGRNLVFCKKNV